MYSYLWLIFAAGAIILMLHVPLKLEVGDLPKLFSDEPEGIVERRPDLEAQRDADETYQLRTMRLAVTYSIQKSGDARTELFEITYRGKPGPIIEIEDGRPTRFGTQKTKSPKTFFLSHEVRDIKAFAYHVRTCVEHYCAST